MRGSVRGSVVRAENEYPIAGLMVSGRQPGGRVRGWPPSLVSVRSDSTGAFAFDNLSPGEWVFTTAGSGGELLGKATVHVFDDALTDVTIAIRGMPAATGPANGHQDIAAAVPPRPRRTSPSLPGSVHGRVVHDNGQVVSGATISVVSGEGREPDNLPVSDADGAFTLDGLPEGEWLLRALGPDGETGTAICHVFDNALSEVTIELGAPPRPSRRRPGSRLHTPPERGMRGNLRGRVVHEQTGQPIADATVTVVSGAGAAPDIAPLSNDSGLFRLDGLPAGRWVFRAIAPDGQSGEAAVTITPGILANVVIYVTANE